MTFSNRHITRTLIVLACILPPVILFLLSLSRNWIFPSLLPQYFTVTAWIELFNENNGISESLVLTLIISLSVATLATTAGFFSSKLIAYHKYRKQLLLLAYLPFVLSPVILAVCLKFYFIKIGLAGKVLGVVLATLIIAFPYSVIFFIGFWNRQIAQYEMLVNTLGGTASQAFRKVILPVAKPLLLVCFFQCFLIAWFEYGLTSIIGYGKVQTLTVKVYQFLTEANLFYAALACCLLVIPPILLLWINKRIIFRQAK
jgi:putative spermidine/putrescine transport system permease protein